MSHESNESEWIGVRIVHSDRCPYREVVKIARRLASKYGTDVRIVRGKWFDNEGWEIQAPTSIVHEYHVQERERGFLKSCEPDPEFEPKSERDALFDELYGREEE